jgi:hypothetical protein
MLVTRTTKKVKQVKTVKTVKTVNYGKKKNPDGARFSAPLQTGSGAHPASCTMGTGSFLGVEIGRGVTLTPHPY